MCPEASAYHQRFKHKEAKLRCHYHLPGRKHLVVHCIRSREKIAKAKRVNHSLCGLFCNLSMLSFVFQSNKLTVPGIEGLFYNKTYCIRTWDPQCWPPGLICESHLRGDLGGGSVNIDIFGFQVSCISQGMTNARSQRYTGRKSTELHGFLLKSDDRTD